MITDDELAITCIVAEAGNQPHEGQTAVGCVILNRIKYKYSSDGTMIGTVLHKWAFSWAWAAMENGRYQQVAFDLGQAETRASQDFDELSENKDLWGNATQAWADAKAWSAGGAAPMSFVPGPDFKAGFTDHTVLYLNPKITNPMPAWANPKYQDCVLWDHTFFHDGAFPYGSA